jgi:hypothetical protein
LEFDVAFNKVPNTVHLGSHLDETGFYSTWHINKAHYLESWSDARAYDGTVSIVQPMIEPLYAGKSAHDVLQTLLDPSVSAYNAVWRMRRRTSGGGGAAAPAAGESAASVSGDEASKAALGSNAAASTPMELAWRKALHDGWIANTAFTPKTLAPKGGAATAATVGSGIEISFKPDASVYDGRYANNGWLQELPRQVTSMSWDNAALMNMDLMGKLGIEENEAIELTLNGRKIITPVLMSPGHPNDAVTVHLRIGTARGSWARGAGVGFNAYALRTSDAPLAASGLTIARGQGTYDLCVTKVHNIEHRGAYAQRDLEHPLSDKDGTYSLAGHEAMERSIIRYATYEEAMKNPDFAHDGHEGFEWHAGQQGWI